MLLTVFLVGCGAEASIIEITYPTDTLHAVTSFSAGTEGTAETETEAAETFPLSGNYVLNISSKKFHDIACASVPTIKEKNREEYSGDRAELIARGFAPCKRCNP